MGGLLVTVQTKLITIQCCYHLNILIIIIVKNYKLSKIDWWWMNESCYKIITETEFIYNPREGIKYLKQKIRFYLVMLF